jgi:hypothetical protein
MTGAMALTVGLAAKPVAADPVLVELFTSQGCSSCPPADKLLGELSQRSGVVALAFHVDYWDYIGWKDKFAKPEYTDRQKGYRDALNLRTLYTPQMVIDGRLDVVGSERSEVESSIGSAAGTHKVPLTFVEASGQYRVMVPAAEIDQAKPATLWLAIYSRRSETPVERGENAGSTLVEYNIVQEIRPLGAWNGNAIDLPLDVDESDSNMGCAVILQADGNGPVLGVAVMP